MKFVANGVKYELDEDKVTFAEAKAMQKITGRTMVDIMRTANEDAESMQALIWVTMKRQDPTLAYGDLDDVALRDIEPIPDEEIPPVDVEADPTRPADEPNGASTPPG